MVFVTTEFHVPQCYRYGGIVALIVFSMVKGVFRLVKIALLGVLVMQILYVLGQSRLNEFIDLASVFKYDVFTSLGNLFPGTFIQDGLSTVGGYLSGGLIYITDVIAHLISGTPIRPFSEIIGH